MHCNKSNEQRIAMLWLLTSQIIAVTSKHWCLSEKLFISVNSGCDHETIYSP